MTPTLSFAARPSAGRWQMVSMLYIADKRPNTLSAKDAFDGLVLLWDISGHVPSGELT